MLTACLTACGKTDDAKTDMEYVKEKGTLIVGITDFAPMDYKEGDEWVGFDADMAKAFAESLGVKVILSACVSHDDRDIGRLYGGSVVEPARA